MIPAEYRISEDCLFARAAVAVANDESRAQMLLLYLCPVSRASLIKY